MEDLAKMNRVVLKTRAEVFLEASKLFGIIKLDKNRGFVGHPNSRINLRNPILS